MRWLEGKAEAIWHLRCIEINGLGDDFFAWCDERWCEQLDRKEQVQIRTGKPLELSVAA
jgi:hypothetical protein